MPIVTIVSFVSALKRKILITIKKTCSSRYCNLCFKRIDPIALQMFNVLFNSSEVSKFVHLQRKVNAVLYHKRKPARIVCYSGAQKVCTDCKVSSVRSHVEWMTRFAPGLPKNFIVSSSLYEERGYERYVIRVVSSRRIARERGWALTRLENSTDSRASPLCRPWILLGIQIGRFSCSIGRHETVVDAWLTVIHGIFASYEDRSFSRVISSFVNVESAIANRARSSRFRFRSKHAVESSLVVFRSPLAFE